MAKPDTTGRILIIGWDAATWDLAGPLVQAGKMPALQRLMEEGSYGPVQSTFPPVTPAAWASVMTGQNPARHGVLSFLESPPQGPQYQRPLVSFRSLRSRTFFQLLSEAGLKVILVGLPLTYPPPPVNGSVISGFMTPEDAADCTYPPALYTELISRFDRYQVDMHFTQLRPGAEQFQELDFLTRLYEAEEMRLRAFENLLDQQEWDLAMVVFMSPDQLQHLFWHHHDASHPGHHPQDSLPYAEVIPQCYERMDRIAAQLSPRLTPQDRLVVMSDHGAGPETHRFHVNTFLARQGLLRTRFFPRGDALTLRKRHFLESIPLPTVRRLLGGFYLMEELGRGLRGQRHGPALGRIHWKRTQAYYAAESERGIWVNLRGREPLGVVSPGPEYEEVRDRLVRKLTALPHPRTGEKVMAWAQRREEVLEGPYVDQAPDVLFKLNDPTCSPTESLHPKLFSPATWIRASHRREGLLGMRGAGIKKGQPLIGARLVDIAPTLLFLLDQPIPPDMDGRVLTEALQEGEGAPAPRREAPSPSLPEPAPEEPAYTPEQQEQILARLRGLGYLE